jgi:hypothetical protein
MYIQCITNLILDLALLIKWISRKPRFQANLSVALARMPTQSFLLRVTLQTSSMVTVGVVATMQGSNTEQMKAEPLIGRMVAGLA